MILLRVLLRYLCGRVDISSAREAKQHHAEQRQASGGHGAHEDGAA